MQCPLVVGIGRHETFSPPTRQPSSRDA
jgi:hypothetical protein